MRILLVEDEPKIAGFMHRGLTEEGHRVDVAGDLASARIRLSTQDFELLIVDRMLPDGDGLELVRELRGREESIPVICVTARDRVDERVEGLQGGADDYLVKPFAFEELLARIAAVSRRRGDSPEAPRSERRSEIRVADLCINLDRHRVTRGGRDIALTAQEFTLLRTLAESTGQVLSRARLLADVWNTHHDPGTNVVDVYVGYLRRKLDREGDSALIHTVRGVGYVLEDRGSGYAELGADRNDPRE